MAGKLSDGKLDTQHALCKAGPRQQPTRLGERRLETKIMLCAGRRLHLYRANLASQIDSKQTTIPQHGEWWLILAGKLTQRRSTLAQMTNCQT